MSHQAITVDRLCKEYVIQSAQGHAPTFYDFLGEAVKAPFRRRATRNPQNVNFWALEDVNFQLGAGEVAGVIGRNGAGKSTLLKILSRITAPTKGRVTVRGRLASLLEVGTGFHPELSGRENVFLNGAILGMTRQEVLRKFDEIVAFAEIDEFVDTPVKRYSSGMYVRLAFAVAAHLETDVLLVDEVLAVGDASFQRKSLGKMSDVAKGGRTVIFVSHNLSAVRNLCSRALLFEAGRLSFDGPAEQALARYEAAISNSWSTPGHRNFTGPLSSEIRFTHLVCRQEGREAPVLNPLQALEMEVHGIAEREFPACEIKVGIFRDGFHIASCYDSQAPSALRAGSFVSRFAIPGDVMRPGRYTIGIGAAAALGTWTWGSDVASIEFSDNTGGRSADRIAGAVSIPYEAERVQP